MTRSENIIRRQVLNEFLCVLEEEFNYQPDPLMAEKLADMANELADKIAEPGPVEDEDPDEELCGDMDQFGSNIYE